jgi:glucokinase
MEHPLLGIEIGGTKLQIVVGTPEGRILDRHRFAVNPAEGGTGIRRHIEACVRGLVDTVRPAAVGVGYGGPVDWQTGQICCSHHVEGWSDFPLGTWLASFSKCPVVIDNDANVASLGEAVHGAGAGFNPVFYVTLGSGVGGGLSLDGRIYHGAKPGESEIGHMRLDRSGTILESRCAGWSVDRRVREAVQFVPNGILARHAAQFPKAEARALVPALHEGDEMARNILNDTAGDLAFGLSHVVHLFHPEVVVIGGGLSLIGAPLRDAVAAALPQWTMKAFVPGPKVFLSKLGEDVVPTGALALAAQALK